LLTNNNKMQSCNALELLFSSTMQSRISSGCPLIDELFNGGLRIGITELTGEAGTGKTQ
jgi:RecA/RadA recombinase